MNVRTQRCIWDLGDGGDLEDAFGILVMNVRTQRCIWDPGDGWNPRDSWDPRDAFGIPEMDVGCWRWM